MSAYLNALGVICALGRGHTDVRTALLAGDTRGMSMCNTWLDQGVSCFGTIDLPLPEVPAHLAMHDSRNNRVLLAAAQDIEDAARAAVARYGAHRVGVVLGTSTSGILESESAIETYVHTGERSTSYAYRRQTLNGPARFLADWLAITGPAYMISTACTSSAKALASARRLLNMDVCDVVLCGGVDTLCRLTANGFASLEAMSSERSNPFSANRTGINLGEAAALFLMSREPASVALLGTGAGSDAHHMSSPDPTGAGAARSMRAALADAGLAPDAIGYLNLHGTGTPHNDAMESLAVAEVFGSQLLCSSTKPLSGHTLGAAGALEAAFCWLTLADNPGNRVPPHRWDAIADPALPLLNFARPGAQLAQDARYLLSNSFAFGGNNTSLILGSPA
ncbi:beta-ketoacyl-[acyl-carrier-protein] synthase family protein [Pigmentiphaga aceris]|uniref:Beta-ketoacyl-[acyl-carrier-protein] synthase family protein n=1 Tax=Pigmentiphaga aceris TaxID=1940612 RepID=A0A5C0B4X9_9BURK|nr:beta-ketoacyl-[acyl-carrier-protein] synthase family protein [Pigmentiphaga aceris]QEI07637.1 beta-ketoacyl-[acyl-carrier-protein] synthase family protein [Pigmentiphaga aceris]